MAIIGMIAGSLIGMSFPFNVIVLSATVYAAMKLTSVAAKATILTAVIALAWNDMVPGNYDATDLGVNAAMAYGLLKVT